MTMVLLTALGVGGATVIGALLGFLIKNPSHRVNDLLLSFAAGVMLAAAVCGLILPSLDYGKSWTALLVTVVGIFVGALFLNMIDKLVPHLHRLSGIDEEAHPEKNTALNKVMLFVIAIAIHNFPEGIAAGVGFGTGNVAHAFMVAIGIALQNIPEGLVVIAPMLAAGIGRRRAFLIALATGLVEVIGAMLGYLGVQIATVVLPFALSFAGGTMLYVISDEMIPETHSHGNERGATFLLLCGFAVMLAFDFLLG